LHFGPTFNIPESRLKVTPPTIQAIGYKKRMLPPVKGETSIAEYNTKGDV
jgi:hypothetical protein